MTLHRLTSRARSRALAHVLAAVAVGAVMGLTPPPAQAQSDWVHCADEGSLCRVKGEALVRFGVGDSYTFRVARDAVMCGTDEFGDPAPGVRKQCKVLRLGR